MATKFQEILALFQKAVQRLEEVLKMKETDVTRDSAVKRFEFSFDLAWKTIKAALEEKGLQCASPKGCFQEAYRQGLIDYEAVWLDMIDQRNETVHTYNEATAEEVYKKLPEFLTAFQKLFGTLSSSSP